MVSGTQDLSQIRFALDQSSNKDLIREIQELRLIRETNNQHMIGLEEELNSKEQELENVKVWLRELEKDNRHLLSYV